MTLQVVSSRLRENHGRGVAQVAAAAEATVWDRPEGPGVQARSHGHEVIATHLGAGAWGVAYMVEDGREGMV